MVDTVHEHMPWYHFPPPIPQSPIPNPPYLGERTPFYCSPCRCHHSSLRPQLVSLNGSSGKHPGLNYASSRWHEDGLGCGIHFGPSHGHAIMETIHFKASFIYETAEQAANVPLRTLEENGEQAATASLMEHPCLKWMHRLIH